MDIITKPFITEEGLL